MHSSALSVLVRRASGMHSIHMLQHNRCLLGGCCTEAHTPDVLRGVAPRTGCVAGRGPPVHSSTHAILRQASASLGCGHLKKHRPGLAADRLVRVTHSRPWRGHRGAPPPPAAALGACPPALPRLHPQAHAEHHASGLRACRRSGSSSARVDSRCTSPAAVQTVGSHHAMGMLAINDAWRHVAGHMGS